MQSMVINPVTRHHSPIRIAYKVFTTALIVSMLSVILMMALSVSPDITDPGILLIVKIGKASVLIAVISLLGWFFTREP